MTPIPGEMDSSRLGESALHTSSTAAAGSDPSKIVPLEQDTLEALQNKVSSLLKINPLFANMTGS